MASLEDVIRHSPIEVLSERFAVIQADRGASCDDYFLVCRDTDETTIIAPESAVPWGSALAVERWFRLFAVKVATPFGAPGFIARIAMAIAERGVNIFVVSTFSKDYILLREEDFDQGCAALIEIGFSVNTAQCNGPDSAPQ